MEKLQEECKQYNEDYVFKRCGEYIVILKKPQQNFKCNEMRKNVKDKKYAKFRCNGLYVVDIIDGLTLEHKTKILHHSVYLWIWYEVNQFVAPDFYPENIDIVCGNGIHYFLSLDAAFHYEQAPKNGRWLQFYDNGQLRSDVLLKDGLPIMPYAYWSQDGTHKTMIGIN